VISLQHLSQHVCCFLTSSEHEDFGMPEEEVGKDINVTVGAQAVF
jgi:hypothetical protein